MLVQRSTAVAIVLCALTYLALRSWRSWRKTSPARDGTRCGPGCGCD